jgi:hypothetical protein
VADLDDVLNAFVTLCQSALYPNGVPGGSVAGIPVKIFPGWPIPQDLNKDIAAGKAQVSVYARPEEKNTTRYPKQPQLLAMGAGGTTGQNITEVRRQERLFQLVIWAPSPQARTAIVNVIDPLLADTIRFTLPDQSSARLIYKGSPISDIVEKANIYRRDLLYTVEYATTKLETEYTVLESVLNVQAVQNIT